jgi:Helix-turn-helix domain
MNHHGLQRITGNRLCPAQVDPRAEWPHTSLQIHMVGWGAAGTLPKAREARAADHSVARGRHPGAYRARCRVTSKDGGRHRKIETVMSSLITPDEAAEELGISPKLLLGHVLDGELCYVDVDRGGKRKKRMFHPADVEEFKQRRTRRETPCRSIGRRHRRSTTTTSKCEVVAFTALRSARADEKRKR